MHPVQLLMLGAIAMGSAVASLLFLRFWKTSGDRLFLLFAASFAIEAVNRTIFAAAGSATEYEMGYYLARLGSFLLILVAIIEKNAGRKR